MYNIIYNSVGFTDKSYKIRIAAKFVYVEY